MIVVADSGGYKTDWAFISKENVIFKRTVGLNPNFLDESDEKLSEVKEVIKEIDKKIINKIFFYGAGCNNVKNIKKIENFLNKVFNSNDIEICVYSDLLGVAHSLLKDKKGWIGILGTGSNIAFYDGKELIKFTPSLGFVLGDEGSATYICKRFLKKLCYNEISKRIKIKFFKKYEIKIPEIISNSLAKNNNYYIASFLPFIYENRKSKEIKKIIEESFNEFIIHHLLPYYQKKDGAINFGGTVAKLFRNELANCLNNYDIKIGKITARPIKHLAVYYKNLFFKIK